MRSTLATIVLVLLMASSFASAGTLWRIDDERREIAPASVGRGLRVAEGAADLVALSYGFVGDDLIVVFELADAEATMYSADEAPLGERLFLWADVGNIGVAAYRHSNGAISADSSYWYGPWAEATFVHPALTLATLDPRADTVTVVVPGIREEVVERNAFWHGLSVHIHDFACSGQDCSTLQPLTREYADQLRGTDLYAERGSCRIIAVACVDTMGLDVSRPDL